MWKNNWFSRNQKKPLVLTITFVDFLSETKAMNNFRGILSEWELQPHDQYLELEYVSPEGDYETILEHTFNEGNWECED